MKTALVTGGTSGIGLVTARELSRLGFHVVITARDAARGAATGFEVVACDFSSLQSIRDAAAEFHRRHQRLDVLVNNAGGINQTRQLSKDGLELTFAVNHLGYFLLTSLLRDLLVRSAPARVVSVASEASRAGAIEFDDLQAQRRYIGFRQYGATKRMNIAFAIELAERLRGTGVTSNSVHPGAVASGFGSGPGWFGWGVKLVRPFLLTPEQGARTSIYLASSPEVEGVTGKYFAKNKERTPPAQASDPEVRRRLWEISEKMTA